MGLNESIETFYSKTYIKKLHLGESCWGERSLNRKTVELHDSLHIVHHNIVYYVFRNKLDFWFT